MQYSDPLYMSNNTFTASIVLFALFMSYTIYSFGFQRKMEMSTEQQEYRKQFKIGNKQTIVPFVQPIPVLVVFGEDGEEIVQEIVQEVKQKLT